METYTTRKVFELCIHRLYIFFKLFFSSLFFFIRMIQFYSSYLLKYNQSTYFFLIKLKEMKLNSDKTNEGKMQNKIYAIHPFDSFISPIAIHFETRCRLRSAYWRDRMSIISAVECILLLLHLLWWSIFHFRHGYSSAVHDFAKFAYIWNGI